MSNADLLKTLTPRRHAVPLVSIIKSHPTWKKGAEVGVAQGRTSRVILKECPQLTLIAVDPFRYVIDAESSGLYRDFDFAHCERCVRAVAAEFAPRMIIKKMTSEQAASSIPKGSLDFVFIDANHTYAEVKRDIVAWRPKVRRWGMVLGHDYSDRWPGVKRAVNEVFGKPILFDSSIWGVVV